MKKNSHGSLCCLQYQNIIYKQQQRYWEKQSNITLLLWHELLWFPHWHGWPAFMDLVKTSFSSRLPFKATFLKYFCWNSGLQNGQIVQIYLVKNDWILKKVNALSWAKCLYFFHLSHFEIGSNFLWKWFLLPFVEKYPQGRLLPSHKASSAQWEIIPFLKNVNKLKKVNWFSIWKISPKNSDNFHTNFEFWVFYDEKTWAETFSTVRSGVFKKSRVFPFSWETRNINPKKAILWSNC